MKTPPNPPADLESHQGEGSRTATVSESSQPRVARIAYIIGTYPILTTTFIDRELNLLRSRGVQIDIISIRRPTKPNSPEQEKLEADVEYLLPASVPGLIRAHLRFVTKPVYWKALGFLLTRPHRSLGKRVKTFLHFAEAVYAADKLADRPLRHLHAHFIDRAATVALVVGRLLDVPYSVTAHANDIYVDPVLLETKIEEAEFVATCTEYNRAHLAARVTEANAAKITRVYHGLDVTAYQAQPRPETPEPVLLAVGQLREKKGFRYLIEAAHLLHKQGHRFRVEIVGEGPLRGHLESLIDTLGLGDTIELAGALTHKEVIERYRRASLFVLPCVTGTDGDRDGIPNVILEAMAMELPVVSSDHSGIPEAVETGHTGILVAPKDVDGLAGALATLMDDAELARQMGLMGRQVVGERFDVGVNVNLLRSRLTGAER